MNIMELFSWEKFLTTENFEAAGVSLFQHAAASKLWSKAVVVGMKVEVRRFEKAGSKPIRSWFWIGTVVEIKGYFLRIRYEGMEEDASHDFWVHVRRSDAITPITQEFNGRVLIPPECVWTKYKKKTKCDLRDHVIESIVGAKTMHVEFHSYLTDSVDKSKYGVGDLLEVVDKFKICQLRVGQVCKQIGGRVTLRYLDEPNVEFSCHQDSPLLHRSGWASCVGHEIQAPLNYEAAPFPVETEDQLGGAVVQGMKLEAVDPLCPTRICAATICKMLKFGYMMIKIDSYKSLDLLVNDKHKFDFKENTDRAYHKEGSDLFCYNMKSPHIFKCGFCKKNGIPMVPPYGYKAKSFKWDNYLKKTGQVAAPIPEKQILQHGFQVGMKLEMADIMKPKNIHVATVVQVAGRLLRVNFDGWESEFDQWLDCESPDIYPIGWCSLVGHYLHPPKHD